MCIEVKAGECAVKGEFDLVLMGKDFGSVSYISDVERKVVLYRIADFVEMFSLPSSFTLRVEPRWKVPGRRDCYATWSSIRTQVGHCAKNQFMEELASRRAPEIENNGIRIERKSKLLDAFLGARNEDVPQMIKDFVQCGRMCDSFARKHGIDGVCRLDVENFTAVDFVELISSYGMTVVGKDDLRPKEEPRQVEVRRMPDGSVGISISLKLMEA